MKKQKVEREIVYDGLGFPIILQNVPVVELRGAWTIDIDLNVLQKAVLLALASSPYDLTGYQIRFIRNWLGFTQVEFGKLFGVTHPAIIKWEKTGNKGSKMNLTTQRDLRLYVFDHLLARDDDFRKAFKIVHMTSYSQSIQPLQFNVPKDLIAI